MSSRLVALGLVAFLAVTVLGCPHPAPCGNKPATLYHDTSMVNVNPANVFYNAIPNWNTNPPIDSQSAQVMAHFAECVAADNNKQAFYSEAWSIPIFYADSSVPKQDIRLTWANAPADWLLQQRVPCWTDHHDGSTDMSVTIINLVEGCEIGFWGWNADWENLNIFPSAESGGARPIDNDGTSRAQMGLTGLRGVNAAGLNMGVFPDELTNINNPINHGFGFAYFHAHNKPVAYDPAYKADGEGTCQYDMCEGFRIQLNPSYSYGSERRTWERKYMDALKKYGAWDVDSSGHLFWAGLPSKISCTNNPFVGIFPDEVSLETGGSFDARFPIDQFRLIARGALVTTVTEPQGNFCGDYSGWHGTPNPAPAAPTLTSISPSTAAAGSTVTLTGTNLTGTYRVIFGGDDHSSWNPTYVTSTQVRCVVPAGSGTVAVKAKTGGGLSGTVSFTYSGGGGSAPTLSSMNPTSGATAGGTACTLTGTNMTGTSSVSFSGSAATGVSVVSSTQARCTSPARSAGACTVTATNAYGTSNGLVYTYTTSAPTLSSLNPTSGPSAGGTSVTLTGTNLTGTTGVSFGGTAATGIVNVSSTSVRCTSPAKSAGTYAVTATTAGGTSNGVSFTYTGGDGPYTATLNPTHDTYVKSTEANKNKNGGNLLTQKNASVEYQSWLKFDLASVQGTTVTSAKLRLYYWTTTATTAKVYSCTTDSWLETTLTWNNRPAVGTSQATLTTGSTAGYYEATITSWVNSQMSGDKVVSVIVLDDQNLNKNLQAYSKDNTTTNKPQLVVISQ